LQNTAKVNPEEVKKMMDQLLAGVPPGQAELAGLWVPYDVITKFPGDFPGMLGTREKQQALIDKIIALRDDNGIQEALIDANGVPVVTPQQLDGIIQSLNGHITTLQGTSPQNPQDQATIKAKIADANQKMGVFSKIRGLIVAYERLGRGYTRGRMKGKDYIRIGPDVWMSDLSMRLVFLERARGADRRANRRDLPLLLFPLQPTPGQQGGGPTAPPAQGGLAGLWQGIKQRLQGGP